MTQLALPLSFPPDGNNDEFVVSSSNARAATGVERWNVWPVMTALLIGPRKSGRSTLARLFERQTGGLVIDDAERHVEVALFHAWNEAQASKRPLLVIAEQAPPAWAIKLPDLRSRLLASPSFSIDPPDTELMAVLLARDFLRRGLDARPELISWLVVQLERSHIARIRAVDVLDQLAMETRKRLSIPRARATLLSAGLIADLLSPRATQSGARIA
ncbi:MAG: chromosomal replication initiator DnaA [Sphingomonas sp.]